MDMSDKNKRCSSYEKWNENEAEEIQNVKNR